MKRAILAIIVFVALGTFTIWACDTDPLGKVHFYEGGPYCGGGGNGCTECVSYDQSGDYLVCYHSDGITSCSGSTGGRPYTI
jgi:hypothetical protein